MLRDYKEDTEKILEREERDAKRAARRSESDDLADLLEDRVAEFFSMWKNNNVKPKLSDETPLVRIELARK